MTTGPPAAPAAYAELQAMTNFSFLRGGSHPHELVERAAALGYAALGIADLNSLAGVVRAHVAAREHGLRLVIGARLAPHDAPELLCYPADRAAYGRLSALLSHGKSQAEKGACRFSLADVIAHAEGQIFILLPPEETAAVARGAFPALAARLAALWPGRLHLAGRCRLMGDDRARLAAIDALGRRIGAPMVAVGDALYHAPERRPLQDLLTCIREGVTIDAAGRRLEANAERHLKSPAEMARLFRGFEPALAAGLAVAARCRFSLDELSYVYPGEPTPEGATPQDHLAALTREGARRRYPAGPPAEVEALLAKELDLIAELGYADYFLTVHDIVDWARRQGILCQGRGSAANSAVCFCLGVTSVDPARTSLLFERFLSRERREPPDIDVDFEHERREEVIQYVYRRYGRTRAALTATVISYRPRSAIRETCKALGLSADVAAALAGSVWGWGGGFEDAHMRGAGLEPEAPEIARAIALARQLIGFPRHLSQHVGGFVLTQQPLVETVPIGPAAMPDRTFIEWDKDDIDALGIMKVDVLALGMLTCIRKCFDLIARHGGPRLDLAGVPAEDPAVYDMLCEGDSLGVFQVESRAQMNMLPRLRPRCFYDLVIEVAIVRPGPIQGDMVHPYLRRRKGLEQVSYPRPAPEHGPPDELERILGRTLGVPLFQEQAMRIAIEAARFTPDEANGLRRAMATFRKVGTIKLYEQKMVEGMAARGYDRAFAMRCFDQVKGFGEYGFPESHSASFALLVYVSSWLKCRHPAAFACGLLNSQPMGFYASAQIVRDAREHGVVALAADVNLSGWDNALEPDPASAGGLALRLGLRQIDGVREDEMRRLVELRGEGYPSVAALRQRARLPRATIEKLAAADAFRSIGLDRRAALWETRGLSAAAPLPLFAHAGAPESGAEPAAGLPAMPASEHVIQDYQTVRLSLKDHPMRFLRERYRAIDVRSTSEMAAAGDGRRVSTAGVVLVRQMPGSAKGVVFVTIEDETGVANLIVWPKVLERYRPVVMGARILLARGRVQTSDGVTHLVAETLIDRTGDLELLSESHVRQALERSLANADEVKRPVSEDRRSGRNVSRAGRGRHPRDVRVIPKSRDFH